MRRLPRPRLVYRAQRDPGKKPKGAKDGWIGVVVERDDPTDRRSPGTMYVYGQQGYLGDFRTNENGFIGIYCRCRFLRKGRLGVCINFLYIIYSYTSSGLTSS